MTISTGGSSKARVRVGESLPLAAILFAFWIILSGKLDLFHLGAGAIASIAIAYASCFLYAADPPVVKSGHHPFYGFPWLRFVAYLPWLVWQIVLAALQVAMVVLSPKMKLKPRLLRFERPLPHNMARTLLAHSITLTPGTVTIDVRGEEFLVHALNDDAADGLTKDEPGNMKERVHHVFEKDD